MVDHRGRIHCSFVFGKARVTPLKPVTIPRLELMAALVRELDISVTGEVFWTDSKVVLGYIANKATRFHVYVANQERSSVEQWRYIGTQDNPADDASRGF